MELGNSFKISASALTAQRKRIDAISSNLANAQTTRTAEGGPYRRKEVVFGSEPVRKNFSDVLDESKDVDAQEVHVVDVQSSDKPPIAKYEPNHPDADPDGYVYYPDINTMKEMADMMNAQRSYEANVNSMNISKSMALKALEIGKN